LYEAANLLIEMAALNLVDISGEGAEVIDSHQRSRQPCAPLPGCGSGNHHRGCTDAGTGLIQLEWAEPE
jgi:hypothetical protein